jgi:hypothetical protein
LACKYFSYFLYFLLKSDNYVEPYSKFPARDRRSWRRFADGLLCDGETCRRRLENKFYKKTISLEYVDTHNSIIKLYASRKPAETGNLRNFLVFQTQFAVKFTMKNRKCPNS